MLALGLLLSTLAATHADPAPLEAKAAELVVQTFKDKGLPPPARDPALSAAARELAQAVRDGKYTAGNLSPVVPDFISRAGGWDPSPRTLLLSSSHPDTLVTFVKGQPGLTEDKVDVFGVGLALGGPKSVLLVLTTQRYATLKPFPRQLPVGGSASLEAELREGLRTPQLVVTDPSGAAQTDSDADVEGRKLRGHLRFPRPGRYAVELMGRGAEGPKVAALFSVAVGIDPNSVAEEDADPPEPKDPIAKSEAVFARINKVRAKANLPPLTHDHNLDLIALDHAEDMATNHFFAHVSPTRGDLHRRMTGRYGYSRAGENLGEASGALAAARAIESSPAHRENLLDPGFTHVGLALFPNQHPGGATTLLLVEIFAAPTEKLADPGSAIFGALNTARKGKKLPPLGRDTDLDRVAARQLARMLKADDPKAAGSVEEDALQRTDLESIAVDIFVGAAPDDATRSQNLTSKDFNRVGIAAQVHSSPKFGPDRLWICVLYGEVVPLR